MFHDGAQLENTRISRDGYFVADIRFARSGIYQYAGHEVGTRDTLVNVYRPASEVFAAAAMRSFAHKPITIGHPSEAVTASNWRQHAVGSIGGEIKRDGEFVRASIVIQDGRAIEMVRNGLHELSAGYNTELTFGDGTAPDGTRYQATQTRILGNHLALVDRGRAGSQCRIGG